MDHDGLGRICLFLLTKEITYYFLNTIDFFQTDITRSHIFPYYNEPQIVTAWMLDSVTSPNGGKIMFSYKKKVFLLPFLLQKTLYLCLK